MAINHTVRFRVSETQLNQIKYYAKLRGYQNASSYLRSLALGENSFADNKLIEISNDVKEIMKRLN